MAHWRSGRVKQLVTFDPGAITPHGGGQGRCCQREPRPNVILMVLPNNQGCIFHIVI